MDKATSQGSAADGHFCQTKGHFQKPLTIICTNPKCSNNRLLCFKCLEYEHQGCLNHVLEIEDLYKRNLPENLNWVGNKEIKQAILTVHKNYEGNATDQLYTTLETIIEQDYQKIMECITQKLKEIKQETLAEIKRELSKEEMYLKDFDTQIKSLYNFDVLLEILDSHKNGDKNLQTTNDELLAYFKHTSLEENEEKELNNQETKINNLSQELLNFSHHAFEKLREALPEHLFETRKPDHEVIKEIEKKKEEKEVWSWDPNRVTDDVSLKDNNMTVVKSAYYSGTQKAVLGSLDMSHGKHTWVIDFAGSTSHWPCFVDIAGYYTIIGIIDTDFASNLNDVSVENVHGFSLNGKFYNMEQISKPSSWRDKKYKFELDLDEKTFTITYGKDVLCRTDLELGVYCPIAIMYCVHDKVNLRL